VHRVPVAPGGNGEMGPAGGCVVRVHQDARQPHRVRVERDAVCRDRARLGPIPPEDAAAAPRERDRHLLARERADDAAETPVAPDPHLLVHRAAAGSAADRAAERERPAGPPGDALRAPAVPNDRPPASGRPDGDAAAARDIGCPLAGGRPGHGGGGQGRSPDDLPADRDQASVAAPADRASIRARDRLAEAVVEIEDHDLLSVAVRDLGCDCRRGGRREQRECEDSGAHAVDHAANSRSRFSERYWPFTTSCLPSTSLSSRELRSRRGRLSISAR
jgi:hypothetical protein